jgi:hypothetical protein
MSWNSEPPAPSASSATSSLAQQEREFHKAVQPGSPISALLSSARQPLMVGPTGGATITVTAHWRFEEHRQIHRNMSLHVLSADNDPPVTLSNIDLHAQNLLHAASHHVQLMAAGHPSRDSSALAVSLRKLNMSHARSETLVRGHLPLGQ